MELSFLKDILVIFVLAIAILYVCHRLRIPTIVGFLITGVVAGPHGLGLVRAVHSVEALAEVGVVLLLFTIGIEFSLKRLLQIKRSVLIGGSVQVAVTFLAGFVIALELGQPTSLAILIGFLLSLSSTAIVLKIMQERAEIDSPHGRTTLGILIFQDIAIVPMMLALPLLAGPNSVGNDTPTFLILAKGFAIIPLVFVSAKWVVPFLLYQVARTRNRELFLLSIFSIGLAATWLTSSAGLSLALGAFLAGLIISESEYSHQALGSILPFRDIFTSFFFISIGMLLNIGEVMRQPALILLIAGGVFAVKMLIAGGTASLLGLPIRTAILVAFAISQVGEFSFILSETSVRYGMLTAGAYQIFLAVSVVTMIVTPLVMALGPRIADTAARLPMPQKLKYGRNNLQHPAEAPLKDHVVVIGFGVNGKNLARAARAANIPYRVVEMNVDTVRDELAKGEPIFYGDATHEAVLEHADIKDAKVAVIAISDPAATRRITEAVRRANPGIFIIVRTRFIHEMEPLLELGADEVIPEEFETSVEIFARVLTQYFVPEDEIEHFVEEVRADGYGMFRSLSSKKTDLSKFRSMFPDIELKTFRIRDDSPILKSALGEVGLRKKHGVSVLAVRRGTDVISNPDGETRLLVNDVVVVVGEHEKLSKVEGLFQSYRKV